MVKTTFDFREQHFGLPSFDFNLLTSFLSGEIQRHKREMNLNFRILQHI